MVLKDKKNILVLIILNTIIAILVKYKATVGKNFQFQFCGLNTEHFISFVAAVNSFSLLLHFKKIKVHSSK